LPNWCFNHLLIEGPNTNKFFEACKGKTARYIPAGNELSIYSEEEIAQSKAYYGFTFNALVPVPNNILAKGYSHAGYHWQNQNWGTKWDVNDKDLEIFAEENEYIGINFETAWGPPLEWLMRASKGFDDVALELAYHEESMMFCGKINVSNGQIIAQEEYNGDTAGYWEFLEEEFGIQREEDDDGENVADDEQINSSYGTGE
jgi:hypothetical protein